MLQKRKSNFSTDMTKVQIKSDKLTPFGGIFPIMEHFDALLSKTIDSTLGLHCKSYGYQYSVDLVELPEMLSDILRRT